MIKDASLTSDAIDIIRHQATERPNPETALSKQPGTYLCRGCGLALFRSAMQFPSHCGWPSFDETIAGAVIEQADVDGHRIEIICARCHAHLGHVFDGEGFTQKNRRHCVNSLSLDFVANQTVLDTGEVIVAGGCFWGIQHYFNRLPGVLNTEVGYTGGTVASPHYREVCTKATGHYEAVRVVYDSAQLNDEAVLKYFFNIHDPTQRDGQGPDRGQQYQSVVFYYDETQKQVAQSLIYSLREKNYDVATRLLPVSIFWLAELEHQQYYAKHAKIPYCHSYVRRLD